MSDIPKFSSGQIGKLDAKAVNKIAGAVNRSSSPEELASPTSKHREGIAQFPIVAMLGNPVDLEDESVPSGSTAYLGGYQWAEVKYNISTGIWPDGDINYAASLRAYRPVSRNAAYGLGLTVGYGAAGNPFKQPEYFPDYAGKIVHLFPTRSSTGVPMLTFQPPAVATTYLAEITGYVSSSESCNIQQTGSDIDNLHLYTLKVGSASGFDSTGSGSFDFTEEEFEGANITVGVNLVELNGETHLGHTLINDAQSCEGGTTTSRTPLPVGTKVVATRMFRNYSGSPNLGHEDIYMFSLANELCVGCCGADAAAAADARTTVHRSRDIKYLNTIERYQGNILREMMK